MTAANGDRITVQRVTQTVAGEYLEWTVTVRRSSPAGVGDPLNAMTPGARQLLPDAVRAALGDWLQGRPLVADGAPLLVGRDFTVGDRKPLFPIDEPAPAAPYAGRTAPRRTAPPEAPVRLWNREHTDHLDVIGWAHRTRSFNDSSDQIRTDTFDSVRIRLADKHADIARVWLTAQDYLEDGGGQVFVAWLDREWTLAGYSFGDRSATIDVLPLPKPPRVDEVLGRPPFSGETTFSGKTAPWPHLAKGDRIGVEHPDGTITTHEFSGDPAHPVAGDSAAHLGAKLSTMRGALSAALDETPKEYKLPDGVGLGTVPEYGQPARENDRCTSSFGGHRCIKTLGHDAPHAVAGPGRGAWKVPEDATPDGSGGGGVAFTGPVGTVTSGLIYARPEPTTRRDALAHATRESVDEVLPMPGGPNDRLAHGARPAIRFHTANAGTGTRNITDTHIGADGLFAMVRFDDANAQLFLRHRQDTIRATWNGRDWTVRDYELHSTRDTTVHLGPLPGDPGAPDRFTQVMKRALTGDVDAAREAQQLLREQSAALGLDQDNTIEVTPGAYADLYARLDDIHDATADPCPDCNGEGSIPLPPDGTHGSAPCGTCNGTGTTDEDDQ
ncbi:zinc finger-like domain-containing protein [Tsukamurella pseudospumae]|uniref:Uncharacterized protein n=1 Tax=Tsukamurella pseudospumae TaxID=239498 RepID=A0A137ZRR2_9ACTN|nr:zinc finger-like domain-containing protein [Tsukamurella pseudospumae]KXP00877.1 hypothetical protein AXK61_12775 [Tsukamurella pseudospumae]